MTPATYKRETDAAKYASDLMAAWPKSLGMKFEAVHDYEGFRVMATDSQSRTYFVTPRPASLGAVNFIRTP